MKQHKIMALYTGAALVEPLKKTAAEVLPGVRFINVLDDSLIADVISAGKMTSEVLERIHQYCHIASEMGAELILETCSSVGVSVDYLQPFFDIPILRIDRPMIEKAVSEASRIGVMATLPTTLEPTMDLVKKVAEEKGKEISIVNGLAEGAFHALTEGDADTHDRLILEKAKVLTESCEIIVLAQGSMARMELPLRESTGLPVLSSIRLSLESLKDYLK
jgi:aspartate/glutamate racemase